VANVPPYFPFYPRDFVAAGKCMVLTDEEAGIYARLMCRYWLDGRSLPSDLTALKRLLPSTTLARLKKAWPRLSQCWIENMDGTLSQERLDEEYVKMLSRSEQAAGNAKSRWKKSGGQATPVLDADAYAPALPPHSGRTAGAMLPEAIADTDRSAAVINIYTPAHEGEGAPLGTRENPLPETLFAMWFLEDGIKFGAIPGHNGLDPYAWAYKCADGAKVLLDTYGEAECKTRARRLFVAKKRGDILKATSIKTLGECWDWKELAPPAEAPRASSAGTDGWGDVA
jgi:uncharacterized protein YdaU (DUF1376 family)